VRGVRDEAVIAARSWPEPAPIVTEDMRLRGVHHITAVSSNLDATAAFYRDVLGHDVVWRSVDMDYPDRPHDFYSAAGGRPGSLVSYFGPGPGAKPHRMGAGVTHHFAFEVGSDEEQEACRESLVRAGVRVTPIVDRMYFKSIYFQDPDGHILEIATSGPGFMVDEDRENLGRGLKLPPWLETNREAIQQHLQPVPVY
jgi:glyoxalase family protein